MVKEDEHISDKDANMKGEREEDLVYIEGQNREMIQREKIDKKNPLMWIIPILIVLLLIPLIVNQFSGDGSEEKDEEESAAIIQEAPTYGVASAFFEVSSKQEYTSGLGVISAAKTFPEVAFAEFASPEVLTATS